MKIRSIALNFITSGISRWIERGGLHDALPVELKSHFPVGTPVTLDNLVNIALKWAEHDIARSRHHADAEREQKARTFLDSLEGLQGDEGFLETLRERYRAFASANFSYMVGFTVDPSAKVAITDEGAYISATLYVSDRQLSETTPDTVALDDMWRNHAAGRIFECLAPSTNLIGEDNERGDMRFEPGDRIIGACRRDCYYRLGETLAVPFRVALDRDEWTSSPTLDALDTEAELLRRHGTSTAD